VTELLPPQRNLPPGHLEVRRRMLLAETARKPKAVRGRVVVLATGVASALVAAAALAVALDRQTTTTREAEAPYLLAVIQSPEWAVHNTTNPFCEGDEEELFGCGGFVNVPEEAPRSISQPPSTFSETTEITGGTKSRRRLLRAIVRPTRPSSITRIELESAPRLVRLRMTALDDSSYTRWQEGLIASAFRDRLLAGGREVEVELENGEQSGPLPGGPATLPGAGKNTAAAARRRFEEAAAASGAMLGTLTILKPYGVAVVATIESADPAAFLSRSMPEFLAAIGDPWEDYDGVDIRVVDAEGNSVWEFSTVGRTSTGAVGGREDLLNCGPIGVWGASAPPCPAS
jgi:hypothetical protein